jgi:hypothetical protein
MQDQALTLYFYKGKYDDLLQLLKSEVERAIQHVQAASGVAQQRKEALQERQYWVKKLVKYARKVNEATESAEHAITITPWLFSLDLTMALECLKMPAKSQAQAFQSERVLREIKERGGVRGCIRYLEYLCMEQKVQSGEIHTELACLYA